MGGGGDEDGKFNATMEPQTPKATNKLSWCNGDGTVGNVPLIRGVLVDMYEGRGVTVLGLWGYLYQELHRVLGVALDSPIHMF